MKLEKGDAVTLRVAGEVHKTVEAIVQTGMIRVGPQNPNGGAADASYVGCSAALSALMLAAGVFAKTPEWAKVKGNDPDSLTHQDIHRIAAETMTHETVMFAALAAVYTMKSFSPDGELEAGYGPDVLWQALEGWNKLFPGLRADNYLDPKMLEAARNFGAKVQAPFDSFLQDRITYKPSSDSLN